MRPLTNEPVDADGAHARGRASDQDRDDVLVRLHTAYAEGLLDDRELDERIDLVLAARTHAELGRLAAELPASRAVASGWPEAAPPMRGARFQMAWKSMFRRSGRWRVPDGYTVAAYKSECLLDLRSAEASGAVITLRVLSYKSDARIVVPAGARVEIGGVGVSSEIHGAPSPSAPVVHVHGFVYKGAIEVIDHLAVS